MTNIVKQLVGAVALLPTAECAGFLGETIAPEVKGGLAMIILTGVGIVGFAWWYLCSRWCCAYENCTEANWQIYTKKHKTKMDEYQKSIKDKRNQLATSVV